MKNVRNLMLGFSMVLALASPALTSPIPCQGEPDEKEYVMLASNAIERAGRYVKQPIKWVTQIQDVVATLRTSGRFMTKAMWFLKGRPHTFWVCEYADGFRAYNDFRSYRTMEEVVHYFTQEGDNDSFYVDSGGARRSLSYDPRSIARMFREHGSIASVRPENPPERGQESSARGATGTIHIPDRH